MKNKKLSPIDELRNRKVQLQIESQEYESRIVDNFNYVQNNFGSLLINTVFNSSVSKTQTLLSIITGKSSGASTFSSIMDWGGRILPLVWRIAQPMLISMATKKVKSFFFGKKKRRRA